jgi:hypothetical protein
MPNGFSLNFFNLQTEHVFEASARFPYKGAPSINPVSTADASHRAILPPNTRRHPKIRELRHVQKPCTILAISVSFLSKIRQLLKARSASDSPKNSLRFRLGSL